MFLGALVDAGLDIDALRRELGKLSLKGYRIDSKRSKRQGIGATKFDVVVKRGSQDKERTLKDILSLIEKSKLDREIRDRSSKIFRSLARAESQVHGEKLRDLHFHEVGDIDSIIDVVGAVIGLKILKIDKVYSSFVTVGCGGIIMTKGGTLPLPAPAALCLLKGIPLVSSKIRSELVTPTGAALLANLVDGFIQFPDMVLKGIGYGAGAHNIKEGPNCLRVMVGEAKESFIEDRIAVLEANIDDMNPVDYEHLMERLFKEGALDAYLVPVQMKKTRPGVLLTVLTEKRDLDKLSLVIFNESTTIGVRYYETARKKLKRDFVNIRTRFGDVKVKVSSGPEGIRKAVPEYEDCKRLAASKKIPISKIRKEVEKAI
jgi:uncharacterized protein (TIGR00299 family) protein